jgi:hypothetical protein
MKNLFHPETKEELITRLNKLTPETKGQWGKMDVAQMLAHCSKPLSLALLNPKPPRSFMGKLFGKSAKKGVMGPVPFKKNGYTPKEFRVTDPQIFEEQKKKILALIHQFTPENISDTTHPFFGKMEHEEWAQGNWKHLEYHLGQFGV